MQPPRPSRLVLLGSSTRAAAESARRAGCSVFALDAFGDEDLREVAAWRPLGNSAEAILAQLDTLPPAPIVITGGGERWLPHLAAHARCAPHLLAPDPDQIAQLRSLDQWADFGRGTGFPLPAIRHDPPPTGSRQHWLWKPRHSLGGIGIRLPGDAPGEEGYWQHYLPGRAYGASFLATPQGEAHLLGVCRMLRRPLRCPGPRFAYAGSAGPLPLARALADRLRVLGERIVCRTGLRGLFGIDLLRDTEGRWWLLEINPRYTASMELLDRGPVPLIALHCAAMQNSLAAGQRVPALDGSPGGHSPDERHSRLKLILYARRTLRFPAEWDWQAGSPQASPDRWPGFARALGGARWVGARESPAATVQLRLPGGEEWGVALADRPSVPAVIGAGEPLLTVLGRGPSLSPLLRWARELSTAIHRALPLTGETNVP